MREATARSFARRLYRQHHGAEIAPNYLNWRSIAGADGRPRAVLGYRSAEHAPIFLEQYLDRPIELLISAAADTHVRRDRIVEIGCLAALPTGALMRLWELTAAALQDQFDVAVATLSEPLRAQFSRIGLPFTELARAQPAQVEPTDDRWGRYCATNPTVCMGWIADGADTLASFAARRGYRA